MSRNSTPSTDSFVRCAMVSSGMVLLSAGSLHDAQKLHLSEALGIQYLTCTVMTLQGLAQFCDLYLPMARSPDEKYKGLINCAWRIKKDTPLGFASISNRQHVSL